MPILKKFDNFVHSTPTRLIVGYYIVFTLAFAVILWLPISLESGVSISFLDALFTSTSGLSSTGLTSVNLSQTFNYFGLFIIVLIMQIGAMGVTMISTAVWLVAGHKISTKERALIMTDQNQINLSGVVKLVKSVLISFLVIEVICMLILGNYFYFAGYCDTYWLALFKGAFGTISAITNAGFETTGLSLIPYQHDYFVQLINIFLIFFGTMGFPVILDIRNYFQHKIEKKRFNFSIYTKITMFTTLILWLIGIIGFYLFEANNFLVGKGVIEGFFFATFHSLTTRNAGLTTTNITAFANPTLIMFCVLMFIGSSPNSTGGGIRTTTFAIVCLAIYSFATGKEHINVFGREIEHKTVYKAFVIYIFATIIVAMTTLAISTTDSFSFFEIFFEVCSAFGTTGLTLGITPYLSSFAKILLIIVMFIGRIGITTSLLLFRKKATPAKVRYPKTDLIIG